MATSMKTSQHNRSNSVPSAPHPVVSQLEEHFHRLNSSDSISTSSCSSSISQKLNALQEFHGCIHEMLRLPTTQRTLSQESCKIWTDELLEGSLKMLDICSTSKEALLQSKESIHELQSAARRKRSGGEKALAIEGGKYLSSRKNVKKAIKKALENLKGNKKKEAILLSSSNMEESESFSMIRRFKEAEDVTLAILGSLLCFISGLRVQPKQRRWSVSKLMKPKRVGCDFENSNTNEFEKVDTTLLSLLCHKPQDFQNHMENLELSIEVLEAGIEQLQRQLIRIRVSLLNIPIKH
ncbi:uncharacterized protein G2W53_031846 [Senna tora]|uniref:Uncharacterized protein n=1 Tax=Senna tora TaxID=362788 RepID=A0A834SXS1_9FABA|nr:uncharacterized protein G2W53_031846 [Senna tora]